MPGATFDRGGYGAAMESWPGRPFPLGAAWDGERDELLALHRERRARRALPVRRRRPRDAHPGSRESTAFTWHGYVPGVGPDSATATASTALRALAGPPLQPEQAAARPVRQGDRRAPSTGTRPNVLGYVPGRPTRSRPGAGRQDDAGRDAEGVVIDPAFDWEGDRHLETPWHGHDHLRGPRQGVHDAPSGRARGAARHLRGPRLRGGARAPASLGVTAVELLPIHRSSRELPGRPGPDELLGLPSIGYFAPHGALRRDRRRAASRCASSRAWSRRSTARGSR